MEIKQTNKVSVFEGMMLSLLKPRMVVSQTFHSGSAIAKREMLVCFISGRKLLSKTGSEIGACNLPTRLEPLINTGYNHGNIIYRYLSMNDTRYILQIQTSSKE